MKPAKVLIFGTFDLFHPGHMYFITEASKYGELTVVVARDKTVRKLKKKWPKEKERTRLSRIAALPIVKQARLGDQNLDKKYLVLNKVRPDIICLGYDQKYFIAHLPQALKDHRLKTKIVRLKSFKPEIYKSSKVKKTVTTGGHRIGN
jgi:FAD synthetase